MTFSQHAAQRTAQSPHRTRLIAALHVKKRDLGLDDDLYRDVLESHTGKRSAADLNEGEITAVLAKLDRQQVESRKQLLPATPMGRKLQALWMSLFNLGIVEDKSDQALVAFVKRQTKLASAQWLRSASDMEKVAEALKDWLARDGKVDWKPRRGDAPFAALPSHRVCEAQWALLSAKGPLPAASLVAFAMTVHGKGFDSAHSTNGHWGHVSRKLGQQLRRVKGRAA